MTRASVSYVAIAAAGISVAALGYALLWSFGEADAPVAEMLVPSVEQAQGTTPPQPPREIIADPVTGTAPVALEPAKPAAETSPPVVALGPAAMASVPTPEAVPALAAPEPPKPPAQTSPPIIVSDPTTPAGTPPQSAAANTPSATAALATTPSRAIPKPDRSQSGYFRAASPRPAEAMRPAPPARLEKPAAASASKDPLPVVASAAPEPKHDALMRAIPPLPHDRPVSSKPSTQATAPRDNLAAQPPTPPAMPEIEKPSVVAASRDPLPVVASVVPEPKRDAVMRPMPPLPLDRPVSAKPSAQATASRDDLAAQAAASPATPKDGSARIPAPAPKQIVVSPSVPAPPAVPSVAVAKDDSPPAPSAHVTTSRNIPERSAKTPTRVASLPPSAAADHPTVTIIRGSRALPRSARAPAPQKQKVAALPSGPAATRSATDAPSILVMRGTRNPHYAVAGMSAAPSEPLLTVIRGARPRAIVLRPYVQPDARILHIRR